jgi:hypothetical protein
MPLTQEHTQVVPTSYAKVSRWMFISIFAHITVFEQFSGQRNESEPAPA